MNWNWRRTFYLIAALLAAIQAAAEWPLLSSGDTISYLDVGDEYWKGNRDEALNGCWSPFYSWLLGLAFRIFHPTPYYEFGLIRIVNFLLFLFAMNRFEFFLSNFVERFRPAPESTWRIAGYSLFLWASLVWIGIDTGTPDLGVSAMVYWAAGLLLQMEGGRQYILKSFLLGLVLGTGYLWKTILFFGAFFFLIAALLMLHGTRRRMQAGLAFALGFFVISGHFILGLSMKKDRLTIGEAGKLNYVWLVMADIPDLHWQGGPTGDAGTPLHPTRKIHHNPDVFEFGTPLPGTYPPWYDPSYWYEGMRLRFDFSKQIHALANNLLFYYGMFLSLTAVGFLILVRFKGRITNGLRELAQGRVLLIPGVGGLGLYAVGTNLPLGSFEAQPYERLIAPFAVLAIAGCFAAIRLPIAKDSRRLLSALAFAAIALAAITLSYKTLQDLSVLQLRPQHRAWSIAEAARHHHLAAGDSIAILGKEYEHVEWARLLKVKIIAQLPEQTMFWLRPGETRSEILDLFRRSGARAVVRSPAQTRINVPAEWQNLGNTGYQILFLNAGESSTE